MRLFIFGSTPLSFELFEILLVFGVFPGFTRLLLYVILVVNVTSEVLG